MNILFMGTPNIAINTLERVLNSKYNLVGIVSQPDKFVDRKKELKFTPTKKFGIANNIKVFQPKKIIDIYDELKKINLDLIVTCAYGQIVPEKILNLPKFGCVNLHASILPKCRGGAPIHWTIMNGEKETGISLMFMEKEMDTGDVITIKKIRIEKNETYDSLYKKLSILAGDTIMENLENIFNNNIDPIKQDNDLATYCYNIKKENEKIDWNKNGEKISNHIRGLSSNPGAFSILNNKIVKFYDAIFELTNKYEKEKNGLIVEINKDNIVIKVRDGIIKITDIQIESRKRANISQIINGNSLLKLNAIFN